MINRDENSTRTSVELERLIRDCSIENDKAARRVKSNESARSTEWICRLSENGEGAEKMIDLLVESQGDTKQLDRFSKRLDEIIHEISDHYGGILSCNSIFTGVTQIRVMLEPGKKGELMMRLAFLPDVEKVEEGMYYGNNRQPIDEMTAVMPYPVNTKSSNKILVVMKDEIVLGY